MDSSILFSIEGFNILNSMGANELWSGILFNMIIPGPFFNRLGIG